MIVGDGGNPGVTKRCDLSEKVTNVANCSASNCEAINNVEECNDAVSKLVPSDVDGLAIEVETSRAPHGCSAVPVLGGEYFEGVFNNDTASSTAAASDLELLCRCPPSIECKIVSSSALTITTALKRTDDLLMRVLVETFAMLV